MVARFRTRVSSFLKKFEATVRCCTKTVYVVVRLPSLPIWHKEIEDLIVLKNKGTEDNRVRKLDFSIQISKLFYDRFIANGEISLFSPATSLACMTLSVSPSSTLCTRTMRPTPISP